MTPKQIFFTRDQVVQAGFNVVKEQGLSALSARRVAERLGSSTAPLYSYFSSMEELEHAIGEKVHELLLEYASRPYTPRPDLNMGVGVVLFARDHPKFFTAVHTKKRKSYDADNEISEHMLQQLKSLPLYKRMSEDAMRSLFSKLKIFSHGLALLACTEELPYDNDDYIIYIFWELGEELIEATLQKMGRSDEYASVHGLKVQKNKIKQLAEWRKKYPKKKYENKKGRDHGKKSTNQKD